LNETHQLLVYANDVNLLDDTNTIKRTRQNVIETSKDIGVQEQTKRKRFGKDFRQCGKGQLFGKDLRKCGKVRIFGKDFRQRGEVQIFGGYLQKCGRVKIFEVDC
jgi:hypothetical protein